MNTCDDSNQFDTWRYNYINLPNSNAYGNGTLSVKVPIMAEDAIVATLGENVNFYVNDNYMNDTPVYTLYYDLTVVNCSSSVVQFSTLDSNNELVYLALNACGNQIVFVDSSSCNSNNNILCDWTVNNFKTIYVDS